MVVRAGAAAALVIVNTNMVILTAVQNGEGVAKPEVQRPEKGRTVLLRYLKSGNTTIHYCIGYYRIYLLYLSGCIFCMFL